MVCNGPCLEHCYNSNNKFIYGFILGILLYHIFMNRPKRNNNE